MLKLWQVLPHWVGLVPLFSLLVSALIGLRLLLGTAKGDAAEPLTARLSSLAALAALLLLLAIDLSVYFAGWPGHQVVFVWFASGHWQATISFLLDDLSLPVATVVALIGWLVMHFSANYLHREVGFHRFFMAMGMFLAGIQFVLLAGNGLLAFLGWEMCGVASFLLIGYAWQRPVATGNALFAFVSNRVGDAGFLLALGFAGAWLSSFEWPAINAANGLSLVAIRLLLIGFVAAALVKSAQLPLTPWIARALEGPTPSSAIFYGAVLVHAGVYLLLRLSPLLQQVPDVMLVLVAVGLLTALYAWLCGLVQTDVKSALIYATVLQVALMVVAIGCGWTLLAEVHLCLHAAWRTWHFLLAPSWLTVTRQAPQPPPRWLLQQQWLYTAALEGFWIDRLAFALLLRPTQAIAQDARGLEENFIDRLIGQPGQGKSMAAGLPLVVGDGVPGVALARLAELLQQLENRLSLRGRGGLGEQFLRQTGRYLRILENLLEQPRYLMMAVMATFVVIL
jgi:NADH:ubiquinone oxidoreductase subunit 5 (subunit L)/multisubunit Na+/H+ antiporter MnhA subunit